MHHDSIGDSPTAQPARSGRPTPTEEAGALIAGRYKVIDRVGAGGMGTVYRCHDQQLDRSVAVKRMHADTANSAMGRTRFAREAKAISDLAHPNIVTLLDSGEGREPTVTGRH